MNHIQESIRTKPKVTPHILLMEDGVNLGKGIQKVLTDEGYTVDLAMTGMAALNAFRNNGFDLLVADLKLPDIDGIEVIKRVKEERPETEVIVITGYSSVPSVVEAMKAGVSDYLPKPFTVDKFKEAVEKALKRRQEITKDGLIVQPERERLNQSFWVSLIFLVIILMLLFLPFIVFLEIAQH